MKKTVKVGIMGIGVLVSYISISLTPLIWVMLIFELSDYITGLISAFYKEGISKKEAVKGLVKKLSYIFLIGISFCMDFVINNLLSQTGIDFKWNALLGVMTVCYLISVEGISILENLSEIGITVPFLSSTLKVVKEKIEKESEKELNSIKEEK